MMPERSSCSSGASGRSGQLAGQLRPRGDADLVENARQMLLDGRRGDAERGGDVAVAVAAKDEFGDLQLAAREAIPIPERRDVGADLPDTDGDISVAAAQLEQVHDERLVVLAGQ